ncbi:MAG TPA: YajQ family cyclic di-GMP-binding protein [Burkholderiales bacterium]|nr:YajQ family cyclic di-GMP-binding protein [Burkholderiales bacterium]
MPSFDIVSQVNQQEVRNALDQCNREISNRFDFKGSDARVEQNEYVLSAYADDEFKLRQLLDVLNGKLTKRGIDIRCLQKSPIEKVSGNKVKQTITLKVGVEIELAKKIVKMIKDNKLKVQASIHGDAVRISGAKKDMLQETINLVRKSVADFPLQFVNFRE